MGFRVLGYLLEGFLGATTNLLELGTILNYKRDPMSTVREAHQHAVRGIWVKVSYHKANNDSILGQSPL